MVEQSGFVEHPDDLRRTPVFFAAVCSSPDPLKYLIKKGAKLDVQAMASKDNPQDLVSPLLIAVKYGKAHNIPYLLGKSPYDEGERKREEEEKAEEKQAEEAARSKPLVLRKKRHS